MKHLNDLQNEALNAIDNDGAGTDAPTDQSVADDGQPDPADLEAKAQSSDSPKEAKTPAEAVADLSKFQKVTIDGREMSLEDLKKSLMRQDDYSRKTAEIARERKYMANLQTDLNTVRANPGLAAEFKKIYPQQYHNYLDFVLAKDAQSQSTSKGQAQALPQDVLERFQKYDSVIGNFEQKLYEDQAKALDAQLQTIEQKLQQKYPHADAVFAYSLAQEAKAQWEAQNGQKLPPDALNEQFLEPFFKKSSEYQEAMFSKWQKEKATKARSVNAAASDTGKGGGTPGSAPQKLKLKDVQQYILDSGEL